MQQSLPVNKFVAPLRSSTIEDVKGVAPPVNSLTMDPLISRLLLDDDNEDEVLDYGSVLEASRGVAIWRLALLKGRLPLTSEFDVLWPEEPLFAQTQAAMADLQFPRFVLKHPDTVNSVLRSILTV